MKDVIDRVFASLSVPNRIQSVRVAASFLVSTAKALNIPAAKDGLFEVAVVEALNNAFTHGRQDPSGSILCELELVNRCLKIRVLDEAFGAPLELALPGAVAPWPERTADQWESIPESGYGLHLMAAVFPKMRPISRDEYHGIEMELAF
jgi:anti-sigma regulatory factor (Ser/Thr protein kinase)